MSVLGQRNIQLSEDGVLHGHLARLPCCVWREVAGAAWRITGYIPCR